MPLMPLKTFHVKLNFRPGPSQQLCDLPTAVTSPRVRLGWEGAASLLSLLETEWAFCTPCPCMGQTLRDGALLCWTLPVSGVTNCGLTSCCCQYHIDP